MKKYPKIKRLGHADNEGMLDEGKVVVQEKMDGANFRFTWDEDEERLVFGSRNVEYWNEKDTDSSFTHAVEYVRSTVNWNALETEILTRGSLVFFGEAMHSHTLDYDWENTPSFLGFDVWSVEDEAFLSPIKAKKIFREIGLPTAPIVMSKPSESIADLDIPESEFRDGLAKGVVLKEMNGGRRAKLRSKQFKEKMEVSKGNTNPDVDDVADARLLAQQFATEARIKKHIHKMRDRGYTVGMKMMDDLWHRVFEDIIEEEFETIFLGNYTIDTKEFRSEVAGRTANVLRTYLSRPSDSVLNESEEVIA